MRASVSAAPMVDRWLPGVGMTPARCRLRYEPSDPYAVHLTLVGENGDRMDWTFARSLLSEGITGHAGVGDVRIWRVRGSRRAIIALVLRHGTTSVHVYAARRPIKEFVEAVLTAVPAGDEAGHADIDAELDALLRGDG